jgi:hypothetical protein
MGAELGILLKVLAVTAFQAVSVYWSGGRKEGRNSNQGDKRCSDRCMSQALNKYKANVTV